MELWQWLRRIGRTNASDDEGTFFQPHLSVHGDDGSNKRRRVGSADNVDARSTASCAVRRLLGALGHGSEDVRCAAAAGALGRIIMDGEDGLIME
jgi:hypothetical protein